MKAVIFTFLSLATTVTLTANIDRSAAALNERRIHFIQSYGDSEKLEHIRGGLKILRNQQQQNECRVLPKNVQEFVQNRLNLQKRLDQNSADQSLSISIPANNEGLNEFLYQSDILLTPEQIDEIISVNDALRQKRQAAIGHFYKWDKTKPIYYKFDSGFDPTFAEIFNMGARFWTNNTCLNIVEGSTTPNIRVFHGSGCFASLGYTNGATQHLSLGTGCDHFGVVTHEIGHALGFWHEQSRYDRDSYVTVDYTNMNSMYLNNWQKETPSTSENYNLPYDWGSAMHYAESAGKGEPIFAIAQDPIYQSTMGSFTGPSFKDLYAMNLHYDCMCASGATCQNGGFRHPRNCSSCICPSGFGGTTCDQLQPPENNAANNGAILSAQECLQTLSSKTGVPHVILDRARAIHWHITAPVGKKIEITIQAVKGQCFAGCTWGSLDIKVRNFDRVGASIYSQAYEHSFTIQYRYIDSVLPPSRPEACPVCTEGGEWSAWSPATCNDTCGLCGVMTSTRTCLSAARGCPCSGASTTQTGIRCGDDVCPFPRGSCCTQYSKRALISGKFKCIPL